MDSSSKAQKGGNGLCLDIKEDEIIMKEDVIEKEASSLKDDPKPRRKGGLEFRIDETPPLHIAFAYAFQIIFTNLPGSVLAVFVLHSALCGGRDYVFMAQLMSSVIFVSGLATLLQVVFGSRLPVTQGSSFIFFPPIIAMMSSAQWKCPDPVQQEYNGSANIFENGTQLGPGQEVWRERLLEVSGGLIAASLVEVFLGLSGVVGLLMHFIGPLTVAPTLMLIGISLFSVVTNAAQHQWGITFLMAGLIIVLAVGLGDVQVPLPSWNRKRGFHIARYPLLRMFSNLLTIGICWLLCYILTVTGCLTDNPDEVGYMARTDAKMDAITKTQWFYVPYPGHFGTPTFSPGIFMGMMAATMSSVMESIGDYYATARVCGVPTPPKHAINRGIAMEGAASMFSGLIGTCHATTSYSNVIGFIAYSGVASRVPWIIMGIALMVVSIFGKLAGALASIPEPILGGMALVGLGLVIIVGMTQLHSVDLTSTRNQMTLGLSLMLGMIMPAYIKDNKDVVKTGLEDVDQVFRIFLSTGPFIGGIVGLIMDNILPGTRKERGMIPEEGGGDNLDEDGNVNISTVYDLPFCTEGLRRFKIFRCIPILPCFNGFPCSCKPSPCRKKQSHDKQNSPDSQLHPVTLNVTSL